MRVPARTLPSGTVTFLFADVEGSTDLARDLGAAWARHRAASMRIVADAVGKAGGLVVDAHGDELFAVFARASDATRAAESTHGSLRVVQAERPIRVRIGLHTGEAVMDGDGYVGLDVHLARRVCSVANGAETLLSQTTADLLGSATGVLLSDLGPHVLAGFPRPQRLYALGPERARATRRPPPDLADGRLQVGELRPLLGSRRQGSARKRSELEDLGHRLRALRLADDAPEDPLTRLARATFDAGRAVAEAEHFLEEIDRPWLEQQLAERRSARLSSAVASAAAARLAAQLAALDAISARVDNVMDAAIQVRQLSGRLIDAGACTVEYLESDLGARTHDLYDATAFARATVPGDAGRLRRTRFRGVHRLRDEFVVVVDDEVGGERRVAFATAREARGFRTALALARATRHDATPSSSGGSTGSGGAI